MATILLSAAGAAVGGSVGGTLAGLSTAAIGRAVGATLGQAIDQRLLGQGSDPVETGKVDRFRLTQSGDGTPIAQVYGRMRVGGQVIWASDFEETSTTSGRGKGGPKAPQTTQYSYTVSLAVAICEGEISTVGRVWADGEEVARDDLNLRIYTGTNTQLPDPTMEAIEGAGMVPAYRGTAYVVMENLPLQSYGNRVPQFTFEVVRPEQPNSTTYEMDLSRLVKAVALIPGTGEYALASSTVFYSDGPGSNWAANTHSPSGKSDFSTSMESLSEDLPACDAVSLVVSWFGNDLRCGECQVLPKIERAEYDAGNMPWTVSGVTRSSALEVERVDDRPIYGGTPTDASVVEAIRHMNGMNKRVMFYPFILMDQREGNDLPDPWTGTVGQPKLPWRGRITTSIAPGLPGSPDQTSEADAQVAAFFGSASASDFIVHDGTVSYTGADEWGLRRFILHYAALCAAAGGVSAFCIGSEMRGLTQIRGASGFAAVEALRGLAAEVRALLGAETKIGYAADWSEYFGYQPQDGTGDRYFHLDPLWADPNIDFVGIDNYMPLSDWRDGEDHKDRQSGWDSIYDLAYLSSNVEGGEGFDWYYRSPEAEAAQDRTDITDAAYDEPWVWRYKDIRNWWSNAHHERIQGARSDTPTAWIPQSKPIWFTELGCAAIDKGTNQPNKFLDSKSSESLLPKFSTGSRDDLIQLHYLRATLGYWSQSAKNPISKQYGSRMIDLKNSYVWAWDTRPYPVFPNNQELWSDGVNHGRGHWLNGRVGSRTLASVVEEICFRSGLREIDTSQLYGIVAGYVVGEVADARTALQPLMLRFGFDAVERDGVLCFVMRRDGRAVTVNTEALVLTDEIEGVVEHSREAEAEMSGRVRLRFIEAGSDFQVVAEEAILQDDSTQAVTSSDLPLAMSRTEGRQVAERWLAEARVSRDTVRFALPPSMMGSRAGDVVDLRTGSEKKDALYRIDRIEHSISQLVEAVRIVPQIYHEFELMDVPPRQAPYIAPAPVLPLFLDLPLLTGEENPIAPHLAISAKPWPGSVAVYSSSLDEDYTVNEIIAVRSVIGVTETPLMRSSPGLWDDGDAVQIKMISGTLESRSESAVLNGANLAAIGDGSKGNWELFQFQRAELIAPGRYLLSRRLRGQLGSDGLMPYKWPKGSWFVLLNGAPAQIDLKSNQRRIDHHYRIGPAQRAYDDPTFQHVVEAFDGNGLRPYAPCHLECAENNDGSFELSWLRRTRIDGDSWDLAEVPLGEASETYRIRILNGDAVIREATCSVPRWTYNSTMRQSDAASAPDRIEVSQISERYGAGLGRSVDLSI